MLEKDVNITGMAKKMSRAMFDVEFDGRVLTSEKLLPLRRYGEYIADSNTIFLSSHLSLDKYRSNFMNKVLKHELCHWYAYKYGMDYHDGSKEFEDLLRKHQCITNGNYPHAIKLRAFSGTIQLAECSECGLAQFDQLPNTRPLLTSSYCCSAPFDYSEEMEHDYEYYYYL